MKTLNLTTVLLRGYVVSAIMAVGIANMKADNNIYLTVNDRTMTVSMADNVATKALRTQLEQGDITISMHDYGGWEKVGALPNILPNDDKQLTASPGDIMLYRSSDLVIFYGENSWAYTRIGHIEGVLETELKKILGTGNIEVRISNKNFSAVESIENDKCIEKTIFNIQGQPISVRPLPPGLYIINGQKKLIK